jgi:hypothetical protein
VSGGVVPDSAWSYEPLAVAGRRGIAHWAVSYHDPDGQTRVELDGIFVLDFAEDGRCAEHRRWYLRRETPG